VAAVPGGEASGEPLRGDWPNRARGWLGMEEARVIRGSCSDHHGV